MTGPHDAGNPPGAGSRMQAEQVGQVIDQLTQYAIGDAVGRDKVTNVTHLMAPVAPLVAWHQLSRDLGDFTGRTSELADLRHLLTRGKAQVSVAAAVNIYGMAGVGKTTLAVHLAHQLTPSLPDAQLMIRLSTPGLPALSAEAALDQVLRGLGVPAQQLPQDLDGRVRHYQSLLHNKRAIVVLDNATSRAQVEPLLPSSPASAAIITSRTLLGLDGVADFPLVPFPDLDALELLARLVGQARMDADPQAAASVVELCGALPLALRLAGVSWAKPATQYQPLWRLVNRLANERGRLDALVDAERAVRASFQVSYQALPTAVADLFARLGLLGVPSLSAGAAAALAGQEKDQVLGRLGELVNAQLLQPVGDTVQRYRFHDLVRLVAVEYGQRLDPAVAQAAQARVFAWYVEQAEIMYEPLRPGGGTRLAEMIDNPQYLEEANAGPGAFQDDQALRRGLDWFEEERTGLLAMVRQAEEQQAWEVVRRLAGPLTVFFDYRKHWRDWQDTQERALRAARQTGNRKAEVSSLIRLGQVSRELRHFDQAISYLEKALTMVREMGDRQGECIAFLSLGNVYAELRRSDQAISCLEQALTIFREVGDRRGEAETLHSLSIIYRQLRQFKEAVTSAEQSLAIRRETADRHGERLTLSSLGNVYADVRRFDQAINCLEQALTIDREMGDRQGEGGSLNNLGLVYMRLRRSDQAISCYQQALAISREAGDRHFEGRVLANLGLVYEGLGRFEKAIACMEQAVVLFRETGDHHAVGEILFDLGRVYGWVSAVDHAKRSYEAAVAQFDALGEAKKASDAQALLARLPTRRPLRRLLGRR